MDKEKTETKEAIDFGDVLKQATDVAGGDADDGKMLPLLAKMREAYNTQTEELNGIKKKFEDAGKKVKTLQDANMELMLRPATTVDELKDKFEADIPNGETFNCALKKLSDDYGGLF